MSVNLETILLQAQGSPMFSLLFMVGMIAVMYFFLIRPQAKRAKEQKKFTEGTGVGDKIVTTAGIHGTIRRINEDGTIQVEVNHNQFLIMERSAISMEMTAAFKKKSEGVVATTK